MQRSFNDRTLDMAVKVRPCRSMLSMSIVTLSSVMPCDLWIVKPHAMQSSTCVREPLVMGGIGTNLGFEESHGGPL